MTSARRRKGSFARLSESGGSPRWRRGYGRKLGAGQERAGPGADLIALPQENRRQEEFLVDEIEILQLGQDLNLNQGRPRHEKKLLQN